MTQTIYYRWIGKNGGLFRPVHRFFTTDLDTGWIARYDCIAYRLTPDEVNAHLLAQRLEGE